MGGFDALVGQVSARRIVPRIAALAQTFRRCSLPVFHLTVEHRPDFADVKPNSLLAVMARKSRFVIAGTPAAEVVPDLAPHPEDFVQPRSSGLIGFLGTSLDAILRRMQIETVVITGVSTNVAVTGCSMVAADLGYHVVIPEDCIAASDPATHATIVEQQLRMIARITSAQEVEQALNGG